MRWVQASPGQATLLFHASLSFLSFPNLVSNLASTINFISVVFFFFFSFFFLSLIDVVHDMCATFFFLASYIFVLWGYQGTLHLFFLQDALKLKLTLPSKDLIFISDTNLGWGQACSNFSGGLLALKNSREDPGRLDPIVVEALVFGEGGAHAMSSSLTSWLNHTHCSSFWCY